jgi:hypothetical protein
MIAEKAKKLLSVMLSIVLATASLQVTAEQRSPEAVSASDLAGATATAPLATSQLEALGAPIALYPDALVAPILGASTFPDQVAVADYWLQQNKTLTGSALTQAVDKQSWGRA